MQELAQRLHFLFAGTVIIGLLFSFSPLNFRCCSIRSLEALINPVKSFAICVMVKGMRISVIQLL